MAKDGIQQDTQLKVRTEIYSRVVGYFRPVDQWNIGKKEEYAERETISMESINSEHPDNRTDVMEESIREGRPDNMPVNI